MTMNNQLFEVFGGANKTARMWEDYDEKSEEKLMNLANNLKSTKAKLEDELQSMKTRISRNNAKVEELKLVWHRLSNSCINCTESITSLNNFVNKTNQLLEKNVSE